MISSNLMTLYGKASGDTIEEGKQWYQIAHEHAEEIAWTWNIIVPDAVAVIALLSPGVTWSTNIKDANNLIGMWRSGGQSAVVNTRISTYGQFKHRAYLVLEGIDEFQETPTNKKTWAFYNNILNPHKDAYVTIDRHAYKALVGAKYSGGVRISRKRYEAAARAYRDTAEHIGLKAHQLQAIIWLQYKLDNGV